MLSPSFKLVLVSIAFSVLFTLVYARPAEDEAVATADSEAGGTKESPATDGVKADDTPKTNGTDEGAGKNGDNKGPADDVEKDETSGKTEGSDSETKSTTGSDATTTTAKEESKPKAEDDKQTEPDLETEKSIEK